MNAIDNFKICLFTLLLIICISPCAFAQNEILNKTITIGQIVEFDFLDFKFTVYPYITNKKINAINLSIDYHQLGTSESVPWVAKELIPVGQNRTIEPFSSIRDIDYKFEIETSISKNDEVIFFIKVYSSILDNDINFHRYFNRPFEFSCDKISNRKILDMARDAYKVIGYVRVAFKVSKMIASGTGNFHVLVAEEIIDDTVSNAAYYIFDNYIFKNKIDCIVTCNICKYNFNIISVNDGYVVECPKCNNVRSRLIVN